MKDVFSCFVHLCHCIFENGDVRLSHFVSLSWVIKKSKSVSRTNAKSMLEHFVTKINCGKPLIFVTRSTILDFVVFPDTALIGVLLIIKSLFFKNIFYRTKKTKLPNKKPSCSTQEPETFASVFKPWKMCFLLIFIMFFSYFVFDLLIHRGIPNTQGK